MFDQVLALQPVCLRPQIQFQRVEAEGNVTNNQLF